MNLKWLLAFSVLLNVVLAVAFAIHSPRPTEQTVAPFATTGGAPAPELIRPSADGKWDADLPGIKTTKPKGTNAPAVNALEVEDYPEFVKKLRAAGLSEDTIATLIVAEIFFRGLDDTVALQWRLNTGELTQDEYDAQHRKLQMENEATLETLLGKEGFRRFQIEHDFQLKRLAENPSYSPETIGKYFDLRKAHQERIRAWEDECRAQGQNPADYGDKKAEIEKAYQEEMAKVLGADVASKIQAETDWKMQTMRRQMSAVKISDEEYAQINQLLQTLRQEQQRLSALAQRGDLSQQDAGKLRQAAEQRYTEQFTALLGAERLAEHEKQNDLAFRQVTSFGRPNGLNQEQMDFVYRSIKEQKTRQQDLHKQLQAKQITREQYDATLDQSNSRTRNSLQQFLGADRYERLKRATGQVP